MPDVLEQQTRSDIRKRYERDDAIDAIAQKAAREIQKALTKQQSDAEAHLRIDEILGEATGSEAVDGSAQPSTRAQGEASFDGPKGDPAKGKR